MKYCFYFKEKIDAQVFTVGVNQTFYEHIFEVVVMENETINAL